MFDIVFIITLKLTLEGQAFSLLLCHEDKNRYSIALLKKRILRKILLLALDLLETDPFLKTKERKNRVVAVWIRCRNIVSVVVFPLFL